MANIFEITSEYQTLMNEIENNNSECSDEMFEKIVINKENLTDKIGGYINVSKNYQVDISKRQGEINRLQEEIDKLDKLNISDLKAIKRIETVIDGALKTFGFTELKTALFKVSYRKSERVKITDESLLPKFCFKTEKVSKILPLPELKKLIQSGKIKKGAEIVEINNIQIK